ncbi:MAG: hypothetical protein HFJ11_04450 [Bacilli bacterium]|nr:hypothetical protein [Bacilli bacterium]
MNKAMLTVGIILLSLISLLLLNVLSNYSTGGELDYYLVKETTDAAMVDAIDKTYLRTCGLYRIDKEKFIESFLYRFADSVDTTRDYKIGFYDINEVPPKVSVKVDSLTVLSFKAKKTDAEGKVSEDTSAATITTNYDAILEEKYISDPAVEEGLTSNNSYLCKPLS